MSSDGSKARLAPIASEEFRHACGRFATGVTVATALDAHGRPHGLTVNSFNSISLTPPLVSICLGLNVTVLGAFHEAEYYGINVLAENQREISDRFARKGLDRFANISWHRGKSGAPLITGCIASLECAIRQRIPCGDHEIFIGEVVHTQVNSGQPLIFYASGYRRLE
jgi:flavin reductase (DIM6/NTAB) family NADH-FMN oxidoreductase RutF